MSEKGIKTIDGVTYWNNRRTADFFNVTPPTLKGWRENGLTYLRIGKGRVWYPESEVREFFSKKLSESHKSKNVESSITPEMVAQLKSDIAEFNEEMRGTGLGDDKENVEGVQSSVEEG